MERSDSSCGTVAARKYQFIPPITSRRFASFKRLSFGRPCTSFESQRSAFQLADRNFYHRVVEVKYKTVSTTSSNGKISHRKCDGNS